MKRSILAAIMGTALGAAAFGQGHVMFSNYMTEPYNQLFSPNGFPPNDPQILIQIWFAMGDVSNPAMLTPGATAVFNWSGSNGYIPVITQILPTVGTYTFEVRASFRWSAEHQYIPYATTRPWTESDSVRPVDQAPGFTHVFPPFVPIPEPASGVLALCGFGMFIAKQARCSRT